MTQYSTGSTLHFCILSLATASERGTLVRVFSTADGSKVQELRRGADPARIFSIAFSRGDPPDYLAVSSDKGTVHVFNLDAKRTAAIPSTDATSDHPDGSSPRNPVSTFKFMSSLLPVPYFASERSFAQFRLPEDTKAVVGFGATSNSLVVVSASGSFYTASFDHEKGGMCKQESFCKFVELGP